MNSSVDQKGEEWKGNVTNLLYCKNICSVCLKELEDLVHWDKVYHVNTEQIETESSLKDIIGSTFGDNVQSLLPTEFFCDNCITIILQSFIMLKRIQCNHETLQKYLSLVTKQVGDMESTKNNQECVKINCNAGKKLFEINAETKKSVSKLKITINPFKYSRINKVLESDESMSNSDNDSNDETQMEGKYECPFCGLKSKKFQLFKTHYNDYHNNESSYQCYKCMTRFEMLDNLIDHRNVVHSENITYCHICKAILCSLEQEVHNTKYHLDTFLCDTCQSGFETKSSLLKHIMKTHSATNLTCQHCLQSFTNEFKHKHHRCIYKCLECKEECIHKKYLISYREQHMAKKKIFSCTDCKFIYTARNQLISHVNEEHLKHFPYLCDLCGENFASLPLLRIHMYKKHENDVCNATIIIGDSNEKQYECDSCAALFKSEEEYFLHKKKHLDELSQCQYCSKVFCSIATLNMHLKRHHPLQEDGKNTIYQCSMCTTDFNYRTDYIYHIATHAEGTTHVCRLCKESFISKISYYSHIRKHQIKYDRECHICFNKYTKHTISRHIKNHKQAEVEDNDGGTQSQEILMCDVCGALLKNQKHLIKHSEIHKEVKQCPECKNNINTVLYARHLKTHKRNQQKLKTCPKCEYTTRFQVCLEAHMNRHHLKIRPYQCEICSKTFHSDYTLKGHKLTHLDERPEHYCEVCGKKFISKKALMLHTRIHTGERPYPCDLCDLRFLSASRRRQHRIRKHFEPSIECELCQKKLYTLSDLRRHVGDRHSGEPKRIKLRKKSYGLS